MKRIEQHGFTVEKLELHSQVSEELIDQHYQNLVGHCFYPPIRKFMTYGSVIVGIIPGFKVIETRRAMMGVRCPEEVFEGSFEGIL